MVNQAAIRTCSMCCSRSGRFIWERHCWASRSPAGARTLTTVRLIVLPVRELQAVLRDAPAIAQRFLDHALDEAHSLTQEIYALKLRTSAQRLAGYLLGLVKDEELSSARFVLPFEKRLLAARIGCSQENLSRAFAALRQIGVETQRGIVDRA